MTYTNHISNQGGLIIRQPIMIADQESYNDALALLGTDKNHIPMPDEKQAFRDQHGSDFGMTAIHSDENPILIDQYRMALVWCDPDDRDNVDAMIAILMELHPRGDGTYRKVPRAIITGNEFQGIIEYRCPCCGDNDTGFSILVVAEDPATGDIKFAVRDSLFTKPDKTDLFGRLADGITADSAQIRHFLDHHHGQCRNHGHKPLASLSRALQPRPAF